jgi:tetratricopeptide (TPR) repeat protein
VSDSEYPYTLLNEAERLEEDGRLYEALALIERVLNLTDEDELLASALTLKAHVLSGLERTAEAVAVCDEVIERFEGPLTVYARYYRAHAAFDSGRPGDALADVDAVLQHAPADEPIVADALLLKALILKGDDALALYDEVAERYADDHSTAATALAWKAELLGDLKRYEQGLSVARNVIARFDGATDPDVRLRVASAHLRTGYFLERTRRWPEALEAYNGLFESFKADESESMAALLGWASEQRTALRVLVAVQRHAGPIRVGVAALLIFTVFRTGRRRDRERRRPMAVRLRPGADPER